MSTRFGGLNAEVPDEVPRPDRRVRRPARPRRGHPRPRPAHRARHAAPAAVPRGHRGRAVRPGLLLGRRAPLLAAPGRVHHGRRLLGRLHEEPELRRGLLRPHRPHRGRARRLRPQGAALRASSCARSGRATTRRRACARATTWAPSTARRCTGRPTRSARSRSARATPTRPRSPSAAAARSRPSSPRRGTFYPAEEYHQQYLQKNPGGYCGLGGTGVSCPIGAGVSAA